VNPLFHNFKEAATNGGSHIGEREDKMMSGKSSGSFSNSFVNVISKNSAKVSQSGSIHIEGKTFYGKDLYEN
jgi:hypothetical protein